MRSLSRNLLLLSAACILFTTIARAQKIELAVTFDAERAKSAQASCSCFWLKGGTIEGGVTLFHGLGVVANFTGESGTVPPLTGSTATGVQLTQYSYLAGPRYTTRPNKLPAHPSAFVDFLIGGTHATNGVFPTSTSIQSTANSLALQTGAGFELGFKNGFGLRLPELDYIYTALPNNGNNSQNDFRLAFGLTYKLGRK